nr:unnamed protein product [Callosobruchus chinensis]
MEFVKETPPNKSRKRQCPPETWKKNIAKKLRYSAKGGPVYPKCGHNTSRFLCSTLTNDEVNEFHSAFYEVADKITQDNFIMKYVSSCPIQRRRNPNSDKQRTLSCAYYILNNSKKAVPVCKETFLNILNLKKHRVDGVMKRFFTHNRIPKERRGGDHRSHKQAHIKENIKKFIKKFKVLEKHYCRGKSERQYLSSDLSIRKMYKMYIQGCQPAMTCKASFFRKVFNRYFNIGFNSPQVDVCSQCLEYKERIKREKNETLKINLLTEQRIHKLRAKAFFDSLRQKRDDLLTISYDCEKNLVLPKIPDQITYYKRQLYLYNFTVVVGSSKDKLTKENVYMHSWLESESSKGSNEISSAVYDTLNKIKISDKIKEIRLVSDGCTGQNKNTTIIAMCAKWLSSAPQHLNKLQIIFPVTGHSFLPADRVFAFIEKEVKKLDTIILPEEYYSIFRKYGTLKKLGVDWHTQNWKKEAGDVLKPTSSLHFKIKSCRRIIITRSKTGGNQILVRGEPNYKVDVNNARGICKTGKQIIYINPENLELNQVKVNPKKLKNVEELMRKHFGESWRGITDTDLNYYKKLIQTAHIVEDIQSDGESEDENEARCVSCNSPGEEEYKFV